jgi:hypothetical protein
LGTELEKNVLEPMPKAAAMRHPALLLFSGTQQKRKARRMMRKLCATFPASFGGARYCVTISQAISGGLPHDHGIRGAGNTDSY